MISGPAGVGKTALMVQTARAALTRGWFPGGVLFTGLHSGSVEAGRALSVLLEALGVGAGHIPQDTEDRAALYRSVLAAYASQGRRILVLIDNAATTSQVVPLLPGDSDSGVMVTSRSALVIPQARMLSLRSRAASGDVGLWGAPGSGKTTFLAALYIAVARSSQDMNIFGADDKSTEFMVESNRMLTKEHRFPGLLRSLARTAGP